MSRVLNFRFAAVSCCFPWPLGAGLVLGVRPGRRSVGGWLWFLLGVRRFQALRPVRSRAPVCPHGRVAVWRAAGGGVGVVPVRRPAGAGRAGFPAARLARGGVVSPLVVFVAGLPPGCAAWSPWPRRPGVVLVACPSRALAG
ncbi:MAG: hypothetical protein KDJ22_00315, partial [Candidatus Competibacteraceae bacterium]|nr:hypothetical protein [Candidatus Competibacteraceae bacterium]